MKLPNLRLFLLAIPTTKLRITTSIGLTVLVVTQAVFNGYQPTMELLGFLLLQQGIDVSQYMIRRSTTPNEPEGEKG